MVTPTTITESAREYLQALGSVERHMADAILAAAGFAVSIRLDYTMLPLLDRARVMVAPAVLTMEFDLSRAEATTHSLGESFWWNDKRIGTITRSSHDVHSVSVEVRIDPYTCDHTIESCREKFDNVEPCRRRRWHPRPDYEWAEGQVATNTNEQAKKETEAWFKTVLGAEVHPLPDPGPCPDCGGTSKIQLFTSIVDCSCSQG